MNEDYKYSGEELILFSHAKHWKKYFAREIKPYITGKVLEVGAGLGNNTHLLNDGIAPAWLMLEPDKKMAAIMERDVQNKLYPANCHLKKGTIDDIDHMFDTIIYIDVLEHIETDIQEIRKATSLLNENGRIIILSPAHQFLFSPFDKAIGHYRRYNRKMLKNITPAGMKLISCRYYDTMGYFASLMNKLFLRRKMPTMRQVLFWDRWMVPVSTLTDKLFFHLFGKSIITVWQK